MVTKIEQKAKAIELLKQMNIENPHLEDFGKEVKAKMEQIEKRYDCTVYAITHDFTIVGECYSFLLVSPYEEDLDTLVHSRGKEHSCFAYVWNKDCDRCSELGYVILESDNGKLRRTA